MSPRRGTFLGFFGAVLVLAVLCLIFPRVLAFVEFASRELRYLWWLVAIAAIGVYLAFFTGRKDR